MITVCSVDCVAFPVARERARAHSHVIVSEIRLDSASASGWTRALTCGELPSPISPWQPLTVSHTESCWYLSRTYLIAKAAAQQPVQTGSRWWEISQHVSKCVCTEISSLFGQFIGCLSLFLSHSRFLALIDSFVSCNLNLRVLILCASTLLEHVTHFVEETVYFNGL